MKFDFKSFMKYLLDKIKDNIIFVKYIFSGFLATIVDLGVLYVMHGLGEMSLVISTIVAYLISFFVSFFLQKFWTFEDGEKEKIGKQLFQYLFVVVVNASLNAYLVKVLVESFGVWYMLAQVIACGLLAILSFFIYRFVIFNKKEYWKKNLRNILVATREFFPDESDLARYVDFLCRGLIGREYKLRVVTYSDELPKKCKKQKKKGYVLYRISRRQKFLKKYFLYFRKVWRNIVWSDIIFVQGAVIEGVPAFLVSKLTRRRYLLRIGGDFVWQYARDKNITSDSFEDFQARTYKLEIEIMRFLQRMVVRNAEVVVVPDEKTFNLAISWGADKNKIKIISDSIDELFSVISGK